MLTLIQKSLKEKADGAKAKMMIQYMKNLVDYRGINQPDLNQIFSTYKGYIKLDTQEQQFQLAESLIKQRYGEDKKIGLMICSLIKFDVGLVKRTERWFTDGHIKEWGSSDTYCGKVLTNFTKDPNQAKLMLDWSNHENLWIRRSSCVGFVTSIRKNNIDMNLLYQICQNNIVHEERFNQLGVGWLLREMSRKDLNGVIDFIQTNITHFSSEGLSYAVEKMTKDDQEELKNFRKENKKVKKNIE